MNTPRYTKILAGLGTIMILLSLYFTPARAAADDTTRASVVSNGTQEDGYSDKPSISADGRQIALYSGASNVISRDTQGVNDAFVYENEDPVSAITFTISGNAGVAGTTLSFNDGGPQTVTADGLGEYAFAVSYNWSGTITPSLAGYFFTPVSRSYINIQADQISQNYSASNSWYGSAVISSDTNVVALGSPRSGIR